MNPFATATRLLRSLVGAAPAVRSDEELAAAAERGGRWREAAAARVRLGAFGVAADHLDQAGDVGLAAVLRAQHCLGEGDVAGAADALEVASDPTGAAGLWEGLDEHERAAAVYERAGQWAQAAACYAQGLDGTLVDVRTVGSFYAAGVCAAKAGEPELAQSLLEAVQGFDPEFNDVRARLERLVVGRSLPKMQHTSQRFDRGTLLGKGGNGSVYRARDVVLDREVAYKVLTPETSDIDVIRERFLREARSAAGLNHVNIVSVYDFGETGGELFLAMELVEGRTLQAMVRDSGPLRVGVLRSVVEQACDALGYAHAACVIHRDIKPANLLWTEAGVLKITDFGLAKSLHASLPARPALAGDLDTEAVQATPGVSQSRVAGTPNYMAPEQILRRRITPAVDLYALGVTLFELATGELPFGGGNVLRAHLHGNPRQPSEVRPELPRWVDRVVGRCMRKDPAERFPSTDALLAELQSLAA